MALEIPLWNSRIFQFETVLEQQSSFLVTDLLLDPYTCKGDYQEILSIYLFLHFLLSKAGRLFYYHAVQTKAHLDGNNITILLNCCG